jgi:hypothetical protein
MTKRILVAVMMLAALSALASTSGCKAKADEDGVEIKKA